MKALTWLNYGCCLASILSKITAMLWEPALSALRRKPICHNAGRVSQSPANKSMAWMSKRFMRLAAAPAQWVREGKGPYILEMLTYRYRGHSMSDPAKYRKREEVNKVREETDPIMLVQNRLIEGGLSDEASLKQKQNQIKDAIEEAIDFSLESRFPTRPN